MKPAHYALAAFSTAFSLLGIDDAQAQQQSLTQPDTVHTGVRSGDDYQMVIQTLRYQAIGLGVRALGSDAAFDQFKWNIIHHYDQYREKGLEPSNEVIVDNGTIVNTDLSANQDGIRIVYFKDESRFGQSVDYRFDQNNPNIISQVVLSESMGLNDSLTQEKSTYYRLIEQAAASGQVATSSEFMYVLASQTSSVRNKKGEMVARGRVARDPDGSVRYSARYMTESAISDFKIVELSADGQVEADYKKGDTPQTSEPRLITASQPAPAIWDRFVHSVKAMIGQPGLDVIKPYLNPLEPKFK